MSHKSRHTEIESLHHFRKQKDLARCVVQGLDLSTEEIDWQGLEVNGCVFLGCRFPHAGIEAGLIERGASLFPRFPNLPYHPYRSSLYTWHELMEGYDEADDQSLDNRIYNSAQQQKTSPDLVEALAQRIHDHAIDDALHEFLEGRRVVAVMGGHGIQRTEPAFRNVVHITRALTRKGYTVVSGGGPGIMEAANLGAWLAPSPDNQLDNALEILSASPHYTDSGYVQQAHSVLTLAPHGAESLAIPTWFYGHEPSNLFATHIAKYFANGLREDGLLAIAIYGVIYARGSAGTLQEIFMDLCQNHYSTFKYISPMVFLDAAYYRDTIGVWPMLNSFMDAKNAPYRESLALMDDPENVVRFIEDHPPYLP